MTTLTLTATNNASAQEDPRRISELDADYQRLHRQTVRKLTASIRQLVRDLRTLPHPETALAPFIQRHSALLRAAYEQAHTEGQRDYYEQVSNTPNRWLRDVADDHTSEATARTRLAFYGVSVARLATEALHAYRATLHAQMVTTDAHRGMTLATGGEGEGDALDQWQQSLDNRVTLQANVVWPALQDGYYDGGVYDKANPFYYVFWQLEPFIKTRHCDDCLALAQNSPYTPPGSGTGHELDATPGDGTTECGAGCKCSLRYGGAEEVKVETAWRDYRNALQQIKDAGLLDLERTLRRADTMPLNPPGPFASIWEQPKRVASHAGSLGGALEQDAAFQRRAAQDAYRSVWDTWDVARGNLPQLPKMAWMFTHADQLDGLTFEAFIEALPDRASQTPEQQRILRQWVEAILRFGSGASGEEE